MTSSAVSIPLVVAAIAIYPLAVSGAMNSFADVFFALALTEQVSVLALVFAVVFAAVAITGVNSIGSDNNYNKMKKKQLDIQYPLAEISELTTEAEKFKCMYPMLREDCLSELRDQHELQPEALEIGRAHV